MFGRVMGAVACWRWRWCRSVRRRRGGVWVRTGVPLRRVGAGSWIIGRESLQCLFARRAGPAPYYVGAMIFGSLDVGARARSWAVYEAIQKLLPPRPAFGGRNRQATGVVVSAPV